jgi:hypothetical protein
MERASFDLRFDSELTLLREESYGSAINLLQATASTFDRIDK